MFIQNADRSNIGCSVSEVKSTQTRNIAGSKERDVTEFIVRPKGSPERLAVVTMETPVVQKPQAILKSLGSIFFVLIILVFPTEFNLDL